MQQKRIGGLSLAVKLGRLLQQVANAPDIDPAAQIRAAPGFQNDRVDPECRHTVANNMHTLDALPYLAISTIEAMGAGEKSVLE